MLMKTLHVFVDGGPTSMAHLCFLFIFIRRFSRRSTTVNFTSCSVRETCIPAFKVCFASIHIIQTDGSESLVTELALAVVK